MLDLAPGIYRQRLVIEGLCDAPLSAESISEYLRTLSDKLGMITLLDPVTHQSPTYGWAGWIHWETSGAHIYAWDEPRPFFSVDIYTCKHFDPEVAMRFTQDFFNATTIEHKAV